MQPEWKGPEEWMPLLDVLVEVGILSGWHGDEDGIRLVPNPDFGNGFGGLAALQGFALVLDALDVPLTTDALRTIAGFVPPWRPPGRR